MCRVSRAAADVYPSGERVRDNEAAERVCMSARHETWLEHRSNVIMILVLTNDLSLAVRV